MDTDPRRIKFLWKKEASSGLYTVLFENFDAFEVLLKHELSLPAGRKNNGKNNTTSTQLREKGNAKFRDNMWYEAMIFYNKSLLFAEIDSENVSLAIANRSSCFLRMEMYDECLKDIELAIHAKYPERLMQKIIGRRTDCLKRMRNKQPMRAVEPKLDFAADDNFPGMSNAIEMVHNDKFGRHFIAKCDIDVGKVLMVEKAFSTSKKWSQCSNVCDACFKSCANFVACPNCPNALFCNQTCADDTLHKFRCNESSKFMCAYADADERLVEYVLRSILVAINIFPNFDALIGFVEKVISENQMEIPLSLNDMRSKYRLFLKLNLWVNSDNVKHYISCGSVTFQILMRTPVYHSFSNDSNAERSKRFLMHLCVMHTAIVECNSFQTFLHGGIFLLRNHFNHSCAPNVLSSHYENKVIITTSRRIKQGDQLFVTYGSTYLFNPLHERQQGLYTNFGFRCECEKCKNDSYPISSARIRCDPIYKMLIESGKLLTRKTIDEIPKYIFLKKKCIEILKKYFDSIWCIELDNISHMYEDLSIETLF